jgi:hypothetical protein
MTDRGLVNPPRVQGNNWFRGESPLVPHLKPWPSAEARNSTRSGATGTAARIRAATAR